jgi:hypothetical protein
MLNGSEPKAFPIEQGKQLLGHGAAKQFDLLSNTGDSLTLTIPSNYQQVNDARSWGGQGFNWTYFYNLERYQSERSFTIKVAATTKKETP